MGDIKLRAQCLCRSFTFDLRLPQSEFPLNSHFCLCNSCRAATGSCAVNLTLLPAGDEFRPSFDGLTPFKSSEKVTRWFCSTCGCHSVVTEMMSRTPGAEAEEVVLLSTAILDRTEGLVKYCGSFFVEDTLDGGFSDFLPETITYADGRTHDLTRWRKAFGNSEELPRGWRDPDWSEAISTKEIRADERLKASCLCGGVQFFITRPEQSSETVTSPFSNLFVPEGASTENPNDEKWWIRGQDKSQYLAGTCACPSCRLSTGFEIQTWAFIPLPNVKRFDGSQFSMKEGTLKRFLTTEGKYRDFCEKCGATVFWSCDERENLIDISAGLFDPQEGARCERWLDWWSGKVSHSSLALSKGLIATVEKGLGQYAERREQSR